LEFADYRIKSESSVEVKYFRYLSGGGKLSLLLNDILGIRILATAYSESYPDYFKFVDLRAGKRDDDGYRGVHLYFMRDNRSFPIEIQIWAADDVNFNTWSHVYGYKLFKQGVLSHLRSEYDKGYIGSLEEYRQRLEVLRNEK
jgi:putative GTP pyrophosphokinase